MSEDPALLGLMSKFLISLDEWMEVQGVEKEQRDVWVLRMKEFYLSDQASNLRYK